MIKQFITFAEAASELGTDPDGLRQAYETGTTSNLPVYIHSGKKSFLGTLPDYRVKEAKTAEGDSEDVYQLLEAKDGPLIGNNFIYENDGLIDPYQLGDSLGKIETCDLPYRVVGHPSPFELSGYFRVSSTNLRESARTGFNGYLLEVAPLSWWTDESNMPRKNTGEPKFFFMIKQTKVNWRFADLPDFGDLLFKVTELRDFKQSLEQSAKTELKPNKALGLRSDKEENYLRIIAGLWAHTELSEKKNTAAAELIDELSRWHWDKPERDTIANVLGQAASLAKGKHPKFR